MNNINTFIDTEENREMMQDAVKLCEKYKNIWPSEFKQAHGYNKKVNNKQLLSAMYFNNTNYHIKEFGNLIKELCEKYFPDAFEIVEKKEMPGLKGCFIETTKIRKLYEDMGCPFTDPDRDDN